MKRHRENMRCLHIVYIDLEKTFDRVFIEVCGGREEQVIL